jgi:hypothetical protein
VFRAAGEQEYVAGQELTRWLTAPSQPGGARGDGVERRAGTGGRPPAPVGASLDPGAEDPADAGYREHLGENVDATKRTNLTQADMDLTLIRIHSRIWPA